MVQYKYSLQVGKDCAKAVGRALPISTKTSIEVCSMIRGKQVDTAIDMLEEVKRLKKAVPYKRAFKDIGHRKGNMTSGRFPQKAAGFIQSILQSARSNAENLGLNTEELAISHISAQQGGNVMRGGRRRRRAKRTHIEVILKEDKNVIKKKRVTKKTVKKAEAKVEVKKETPRVEKPAATEEKPATPAKSDAPVTSKVEETKTEQKPTVDNKPEVKQETPKTKEKTTQPEPKTETKEQAT